MNLIVIDNFLPYPNVVRTWALSQEYYTAEEISKKYGIETTWPGKRTIGINEIDIQYADDILSKVSYISSSCFNINHEYIRSAFQLCLEGDGDSWIHIDNDVDVAGILYLSPNAPINSGTTLYTPPPHEPIDNIGNIFNRFVMYRSNSFHKSEKYFGNTKEDGRLTQVFFIKGKKN
jgi:hypothetical protein